MFLSTFAMLALATAPVAPTHVTITPVANAIGCHPQPGKVMGCVTNSHVVAQQRAMGTHRPVVALVDNETVERTIACHPDPSRNRGCFRPAPGAKVKTAAVTKAAPATAEANPAQAPTTSPDTSRKSS
jgi:hypothetical protein